MTLLGEHFPQITLDLEYQDGGDKIENLRDPGLQYSYQWLRTHLVDWLPPFLFVTNIMAVV